MRPNRRSLLALLGVPVIAPLAARLAQAEAASVLGGEVRREVFDPLGETRAAHVVATVAGLIDVGRHHGEINEAVGTIDIYVQDEKYYSMPVNYLAEATRPGIVQILPTLVQGVINLRPDLHVGNVSVHHTGLLADVAEPDYTVHLLTR